MAILKSFSINHTLPYSVVAVQEANLATRWNPLYWQCACLSVNSGNYAGELGEEDENEEETINAEEAVEEEVTKKEKRVAPNYGKIGRAIADAQLSGVVVALPDINKAQADFVPDIVNNKILYSLNAVNVVNADLFDAIVANRPYTSIKDFLSKVSITQTQMIGLIKAGCFDSLYKESRGYILDKYLQAQAEETFPLKEKLTGVQLKKALELGFKPPEYEREIRIFKYKRYLDAKQLEKATKRYVLTEEECIKFFKQVFESDLNLSKGEYSFLPEGKIAIKESSFKKVFDKKIEPLTTYFNSEEGRKGYQSLLQQDFIKGIKDKYCLGSTSKWEMDTMCFYYGPHELKKMNEAMYNTQDFNQLPEFPEQGAHLCTIAGTVIDSNNAKHTVTILTNHGVVDVKLYASLYAQFNQKISVVDPDTKKKTVIDDSFFVRGTKLLFYGQRKENMFHCKQDRSSGFTRSVCLIENVNYDGSLALRYSRKKK